MNEFEFFRWEEGIPTVDQPQGAVHSPFPRRDGERDDRLTTPLSSNPEDGAQQKERRDASALLEPPSGCVQQQPSPKGMTNGEDRIVQPLFRFRDPQAKSPAVPGGIQHGRTEGQGQTRINNEITRRVLGLIPSAMEVQHAIHWNTRGPWSTGLDRKPSDGIPSRS